MLSRGQLAAKSGVNVETIRFYERKGLLPRPPRTQAGYRQYSQSDLERLHFILSAKRHGFTLAEIKELLELRVSSTSSCDQVRQKAQEKIKIIDQKIRELERMRNALKTLAASCHEPSVSAQECPILEAFLKEK